MIWTKNGFGLIVELLRSSGYVSGIVLSPRVTLRLLGVIHVQVLRTYLLPKFPSASLTRVTHVQVFRIYLLPKSPSASLTRSYPRTSPSDLFAAKISPAPQNNFLMINYICVFLNTITNNNKSFLDMVFLRFSIALCRVLRTA